MHPFIFRMECLCTPSSTTGGGGKGKGEHRAFTVTSSWHLGAVQFLLPIFFFPFLNYNNCLFRTEKGSNMIDVILPPVSTSR